LPDRADGFGFPAFLWGLSALPAQPAQPVQLNACSQKFDAYLTGMKSLLPLFHRGGILVFLISSGRSLFIRGEISVAFISLGWSLFH
jgi:hypothetical protein